MSRCSRIKMKLQPQRKPLHCLLENRVGGGLVDLETQKPEATSFLGPGFISGHFFCLYHSPHFLFDRSFHSCICLLSAHCLASDPTVKSDTPWQTEVQFQQRRLTLSAGALWRCGFLQSSARPVSPGLWSTRAGARLFDGKTPAGPAAAAAATPTAAPDIGTAPPAGYGSLEKHQKTVRHPQSTYWPSGGGGGDASALQPLLEVRFNPRNVQQC